MFWPFVFRLLPPVIFLSLASVSPFILIELYTEETWDPLFDDWNDCLPTAALFLPTVSEYDRSGMRISYELLAECLISLPLGTADW